MCKNGRMQHEKPLLRHGRAAKETSCCSASVRLERILHYAGPCLFLFNFGLCGAARSVVFVFGCLFVFVSLPDQMVRHCRMISDIYLCCSDGRTLAVIMYEGKSV